MLSFLVYSMVNASLRDLCCALLLGVAAAVGLSQVFSSLRRDDKAQIHDEFAAAVEWYLAGSDPKVPHPTDRLWGDAVGWAEMARGVGASNSEVLSMAKAPTHWGD